MALATLDGDDFTSSSPWRSPDPSRGGVATAAAGVRRCSLCSHVIDKTALNDDGMFVTISKCKAIDKIFCIALTISILRGKNGSGTRSHASKVTGASKVLHVCDSPCIFWLACQE